MQKTALRIVMCLSFSAVMGCQARLTAVSAQSGDGGVSSDSWDGGGVDTGNDGGLSACGDGVVTPGVETCDTAIAVSLPGSCPTLAQCGLGTACHKRFLMDYQGACNVTCVDLEITQPSSDDNCCPASATPLTDSDCGDGGL